MDRWVKAAEKVRGLRGKRSNPRRGIATFSAMCYLLFDVFVGKALILQRELKQKLT